MGLFGKLLKRGPAPCALESYVLKMTPRAMDRQVRGYKEAYKVPGAQALAVLRFAGMFAGNLRAAAQGMPDFMRNEWPFPYEKIVAEAAALYYFYMVKDYLKPPCDDEDWPDDDDDIEPDEDRATQEADPYFEVLKLSMLICGSHIHLQSNGLVAERFVVANRALSYDMVRRRPPKDVVGALQSHLMQAWNP